MKSIEGSTHKVILIMNETNDPLLKTNDRNRPNGLLN